MRALSVVLTVAACWSVGCGSETNRAELSDDAIISRYREHCERFGVNDFTLDEIRENGEPRVVNRFPWGVYRVAEVQGPVRMFIEVSTGSPKMFSNRMDLLPPGGERYMYSPSLTPVEAEAAAWRHLGKAFTTPPSDLKIMRLGFADHEGYWFGYFGQYRGLFLKDGYVSVRFDEKDNLLYFGDAIQPCDCPTEVRISRAAAAEHARDAARKVVKMYKWLAHLNDLRPSSKSGALLDADSPEHADLQIVFCNSLLVDEEEYGREFQVFDSARCRLAYLVYFRATPAGQDEPHSVITIYIDAATGECVGGGFT